jgi:uncharacterized membrane protein
VESPDAPRTLRFDLERLRDKLASAVAAQPFAAVATAAGIGFTLGGGWTAARLALVLQAGSRAAMAWLGNSLHERGTENVDAPHRPH